MELFRDRTPKQKMKVIVHDERFFELFKKYDGFKKNEIKVGDILVPFELDGNTDEEADPADGGTRTGQADPLRTIRRSANFS